MHNLECHQQFDSLQPKLVQKTLDMMQRIWAATTQWAQQVLEFPMQKHHVKQFPWGNCTRLREVTTETGRAIIIGAQLMIWNVPPVVQTNTLDQHFECHCGE